MQVQKFGLEPTPRVPRMVSNGARPWGVDSDKATRPRSVLVTATPPTPNGDFHVGHLSGPYLGADIYTRYLKMRGVPVHYLTGIDDHQSYVVTKAMKLESTPREVARSFGAKMEETLRLARIEADLVAHPAASPYHVELVQKVFREFYERGVLVARTAPTLYCATCEVYLSEAYVGGLCPHCGSGCDGNACEACGRPNDCTNLGEPRCRRCGAPPEVRPLRRIYFPLAPYEAGLRRFYETVRMNSHMRSLCEHMLADGLPDIAVSQETEWGIPVPVAGFEKQRIYVWFEMGPGYLAAAREILEEPGNEAAEASYWGSPERSVVQFFGFDNGYYHAVLFPATFLAMGGIEQAAAFLTNEFYLYEGSKFSTSRDHAMWGRELLEKVSPDVARFYLAYDGPEVEQTNFTIAALRNVARRELVEQWEPWLRQLGAKVAAQFDGALPEARTWTENHQLFYQELAALHREAAAAYEVEGFSPQRAARALCKLVYTARRFSRVEAYWRDIPGREGEWHTVVALEAVAAKTLAQISAPVMLDFAAGLWRDLGYEGSIFDGTWEDTPELVPAGRRIGGLDRPYFQV